MNTSKLLHLKATCLGSDVNTLSIHPYRTILVPTHLSIYQVATAVLNSFEFDNENFFSFYTEQNDGTKPKFEKSADRLPLSKMKDVKKNLIDKLFKYVNDTWYMLFDYEDRWWFEIKLIEISDVMTVGKYPRVIDSYAENPVQYPSYEAEKPRVVVKSKVDLAEASAEVKDWFTDLDHDEISGLFHKVLVDAIEQQNRYLDEENSMVERLGKEFALTNLVDLYFGLRERLSISSNTSKFTERAGLIIGNWSNGPIDLKTSAFRNLTTNDKADLLLGKAYLSHYLAMKDLSDQVFRLAPDNIANLLLMSLFVDVNEKTRHLRRAEKLICQKLSFNPDEPVADNKFIYDEPLFYDLLDVWRDLSVACQELEQWPKAISCMEYLLKWTDEPSETDQQLALPLLYLYTNDFKRFQVVYDQYRFQYKNAYSYHWVLYELLTGAEEPVLEKSIRKAINANPKIALFLVSDADDSSEASNVVEAVEYYNNCFQVWSNYPKLIDLLESALVDYSD